MQQEIECGKASGHARDFFPEQPESSLNPSEKPNYPASQYGQDKKRITSIKKEQKSRSPAKTSPRKEAVR